MAITEIEYVLFRALRDKDLLPLGGDLLEIGEANWYGDLPVGNLLEDIPLYGPEPHRAGLDKALRDIVEAKGPAMRFQIARVFWATFLQPAARVAIDLHGTSDALRLDLNGPVDLGRRFDLVANLGTLEHVFNIAQAMATLHDHTRPGGLMLHGMPLTGFLDHGFYAFNPTFYWDLAAANGYEIVTALYAEHSPTRLVRLEDRETLIRMAAKAPLGPASLIYMLYRRPLEERPFQIPMQGYYTDTLSAEARAAWRDLR